MKPVDLPSGPSEDRLSFGRWYREHQRRSETLAPGMRDVAGGSEGYGGYGWLCRKNGDVTSSYHRFQ